MQNCCWQNKDALVSLMKKTGKVKCLLLITNRPASGKSRGSNIFSFVNVESV